MNAMENKLIRTVGELRAYLKQFSDEASVFVDTNPLNGGSFEYLQPFIDNSENSVSINFNTNKGY